MGGWGGGWRDRDRETDRDTRRESTFPRYGTVDRVWIFWSLWKNNLCLTNYLVPARLRHIQEINPSQTYTQKPLVVSLSLLRVLHHQHVLSAKSSTWGLHSDSHASHTHAACHFLSFSPDPPKSTRVEMKNLRR